MTEIIVRSAKRNRLYVRRFDHEDARRRYQRGESVVDLAAEYGVTTNAIYLAITPERKDHRTEVNKAWRTTTCETCGAPAMRLVGAKAKHNPDGRVLCNKCRGIAKRERFLYAGGGGHLLAVRCVMLDCANGERWQPPRNFPGGGNFRDIRPKGFASQCRACQTRARREYRHARRVPCTYCGKPRSADNETRAATGLCHSCAVRRKPRQAA